jgi:hypothetical protein
LSTYVLHSNEEDDDEIDDDVEAVPRFC